MDAIVYTSETGTTYEYAKILSEKTGIPLSSLSEAKKTLKENSDIIYLGWIMAGKVIGFKKADKLFNVKILCAVGMSADDKQTESIKKSGNISVPVFALQGGFNINKLHGIYKFMMKTMQRTAGKALAKKENKTPDEIDMLDMLLNGKSKVSENNLLPVIERMKNL